MLVKILKFKGILKFFLKKFFLKFMIPKFKEQAIYSIAKKTEFMGGLKF